MATPKISGAEVCKRYDISIADLAKACHLGKIDAYSSVTEKKIISSYLCKKEFINKRIIELSLDLCDKKFMFINKNLFDFFVVNIDFVSDNESERHMLNDNDIQKNVIKKCIKDRIGIDNEEKLHYENGSYFIIFDEWLSSEHEEEKTYSKYRVYISPCDKNYKVNIKLYMINEKINFECPVVIFFEEYIATSTINTSSISPLSNHYWRICVADMLRWNNPCTIKYLYTEEFI